VDGAGADWTAVSITGSTVKNTTCLENLSALTVTGGATASPYGTIGTSALVYLSGNSVLELARTSSDQYRYTLGSIESEAGCKLALAYDGHLTVDSLTGSLRFVTQSYNGDTSGVTYAEHTYITVKGESIEPSFTHSAYTQCSTPRLISQTNNGSTEWIVTAKDEDGKDVFDDSRVTEFSLTSESGTIALSDINSSSIPMHVKWADPVGEDGDPSHVPFSFTVYKDYQYSVPYQATSNTDIDSDGYANFDDFRFSFFPAGTNGDPQTIAIYANPLNATPETGVYDISISVPKVGGGSEPELSAHHHG
jgi:hypothetical protein